MLRTLSSINCGGALRGDRCGSHGKGRLSLKDRSCSQHEPRLELGVIVYAEYSYGRIRPRQCVADELEDLEEVGFIAERRAARREGWRRRESGVASPLCCSTDFDVACGRVH